jgi:hypothetical protein
MGADAEGTGFDALVDKVNELVRQGNVRRVVVSDRGGRKVLDVPVNAGVVAVFVAPMLMAAGVALAVAGGWRISVERTGADGPGGTGPESTASESTAPEGTEPGGAGPDGAPGGAG